MSRESILESAAQVFRQKGFEGASMADIAEVVQLQKASLYHHFSSKQEILLELLNKALIVVSGKMESVMAKNLPADQKLRLAINSYLNTLNEQGDLVSVLVLEYRSLDPENQARHIPLRDKFEKMWRDLIQEGVDTGVFSVENVPVTVRGLMGAMNWSITWFKPSGKLSIDEIAELFTNMFLSGLKKQ